MCRSYCGIQFPQEQLHHLLWGNSNKVLMARQKWRRSDSVAHISTHQCHPGSNLRAGICYRASFEGPICSWFPSLLWRFFTRFSHFPSSTKVDKTNMSKFQFNPESEGHRFVSRKTVNVLSSSNKVNLFIYFFPSII